MSELNPTGSALVYSTYLGGSRQDGISGIAVDSSGHAYVTGQTFSPDFPITPGAFQTTCSKCGDNGLDYDAFVTELNPAGSALVYSTYLGGGGSRGVSGRGIVVNALGSAYVNLQYRSHIYTWRRRHPERRDDHNGQCSQHPTARHAFGEKARHQEWRCPGKPRLRQGIREIVELRFIQLRSNLYPTPSACHPSDQEVRPNQAAVRRSRQR